MAIQGLSGMTGAQLLNFFSVGNLQRNGNKTVSFQSVSDCTAAYNVSPFQISKVCWRLAHEGIFAYMGNKPQPIGGECFGLVKSHISTVYLQQVGIELLLNGLQGVREYRKDHVVFVEVGLEGDDVAGGSAILLEEKTILTCKHNLTDGTKFRLELNQNHLEAQEIYFPQNQNLDLALVKLKKAYPSFEGEIADGEILDDVLTMGYPPIVGLGNLLTCAKSEILSESTNYLMRAEIYLLSRGAKPGNSGGPVVNKYGQCVGVVAASPMPNEEESKESDLGYGFAIHAREIRRFIDEVRQGSAQQKRFVQNATDGYVTLK